jgi:hypothetical protein
LQFAGATNWERGREIGKKKKENLEFPAIFVLSYGEELQLRFAGS